MPASDEPDGESAFSAFLNVSGNPLKHKQLLLDLTLIVSARLLMFPHIPLTMWDDMMDDTPALTMHKPRGSHPDKRLSAVRVRTVNTPGRYADGNGLYLFVDPSGAKRWVWRGVVAGCQSKPRGE